MEVSIIAGQHVHGYNYKLSILYSYDTYITFIHHSSIQQIDAKIQLVAYFGIFNVLAIKLWHAALEENARIVY